MAKGFSRLYLLAVLNSHVVSFYLKKFHNNTWYEISDLRHLAIPVSDRIGSGVMCELATPAMAAKRHEFAGSVPDDDMVSWVREIGEGLRRDGPAYLRPSAQGLLLSGPSDCLEVIEKAVNWEAEKLYGVEALGSFDEF